MLNSMHDEHSVERLKEQTGGGGELCMDDTELGVPQAFHKIVGNDLSIPTQFLHRIGFTSAVVISGGLDARHGHFRGPVLRRGHCAQL